MPRFYVSLSISGPLALFEFLKLKNKERQAQEHKIYDELDNRFYQKLPLQYYDLDILDPAECNHSLTDGKQNTYCTAT